MNAAGSHIILRLCLTLALIAQSLLPAAFAIAQESGRDVSAFICNPSNTAPSAEAQTHINELMALLGEAPSDDAPSLPNDHCSNCVINFSFILATPQLILTPPQFSYGDTHYSQTQDPYVTSARGPPLGGRAPPHFL